MTATRIDVTGGLDGKSWGGIPGWLTALALIGVFAVIGNFTGGLGRPLFVAGCIGVAILSWRNGIASHFQASLVLFAFAPFVRRVIDNGAGYDELGLVLIGPLMALLVPVVELRHIVNRKESFDSRLGPLVLVCGCIVYAGVLSLLQGKMNDAASGLLKWMTPVLYAAVLTIRADRDEILDAAVRAFFVILPITGLYGILQYVDPQPWDRYWMQFAPILSIGDPVPYGVRVFSTMNSPASFASFTAAGLLLVAFLRTGWISLFVAAPSILALLLTLYRTAWLSLILALIFCLAFTSTRLKAQAIAIFLVLAGAVAVTIPPFSDVIGERLATLGQGSQDGSFQERLVQYYTLWMQPDSSVIGNGFTVTDVGSAGQMPIDGMIIACWITMGIVVGILCLCSFGWAISNAVVRSLVQRSRQAVMIGAMAMGSLLQIPLANITAAEAGFLFWSFVVLMPRDPLLGETRGGQAS
ncbi:O-antigen ligase family protein [Rhizobium tumorigenes]|uniref:O-antigen ligase family protein n=1 Tax=Rhizobium tumorigenes TaxID=2041385 RepID=A0AAF1KUM1_9HYPH|nr:O-antigen ligase family protein [Rhizobium tumorigenes]WFR98560.1 O-antigen ligase family protein [Rhizobium tumorigenes]